MKCITGCGKTAHPENALPLTPQLCQELRIPEQAGMLCTNCQADIGTLGEWTGRAWSWLQREQEKLAAQTES